MAKLLRVNDPNRCIGCYSCMFACARIVHASHAPQRSAVQVRTQGGLQGKFSINVCRGCLEPVCAAACPKDALTPRDGGGVKLEGQACTGCGQCASACPIGALVMDGQHPLVCRHCGICASFCPHGVLGITNYYPGEEEDVY